MVFKMFRINLLSLLRSKISAIHSKSFSRKPPNDLSLVVTKNDVDDTLDFLSYTFVRDEPVVQTMGIDDTCDLQRYLKNKLSNSTAIKLVDKDCETMAMALCSVTNPKSAQETRTFAECSICDPNTKRLLNLWADIGESNNLYNCFKVREIWEITILATAKEARGRGLSKLLVYEARLLGRKEGLTITRMDCTSFFSAKLASSLHFVTLPPRHVLTYRDKKGVPWLAQSPPHPHGHIVVAYDFLT